MSLAATIKPAVSGVFITAELDRRVTKTPDYLQEKRALQELAARMVDQPEEVLPRFVDLAMEITGGVSAGLSLYEEDPAPGVFRWTYLRGILSPFDGATTPRNFSPCGVTLDRNEPVLSLHPERVYDWISDANIVVPELLLVPLYLGGDNPLGTLWIVSESEGHFDRGHARAMTELASFVGIALRMLRTEQQLEQALDAQETLAKEMSHRIKNLFAMTDGLLRMSARQAETKQQLVDGLSGRLHALAEAHGLVRRNLHSDDADERAFDLGDLIFAVVRPHQNSTDAEAPRFVIEGPPIRCGDRAINSVALIVHELATNAAKYGALSVDEGRVDVRWQADGDQLSLDWTEAGGPRIEAPRGPNGFGSALVERTIAAQFSGEVAYDWRPTGLAVNFKLPLAELSI